MWDVPRDFIPLCLKVFILRISVVEKRLASDFHRCSFTHFPLGFTPF